MYSKILAILFQTYLVVKASTPPNYIPIKEILTRKSLKGIIVSDILPKLFSVLVITQTSLYLYVMYQQENGSIPILPDVNHKFSEWNRLEIFCHLCNFVGCLLRFWCFDTLKAFFTFNVMIKKEHELIAKGPYSLLAHPSAIYWRYVEMGLFISIEFSII
ncbi:9642_t:CDS:2 [Funneliformis geosporum]|nr:9642_t:CDS:2 [Funneliformis geosporum]